MPLVERLVRLRRPALDDVELTSHIFHVTYDTVDRELPELIAKAPPAGAVDVRARRPHAHLRIETRARNAVTTLIADADRHRARKGSIVEGAAATTFGPHTAKLLRAALATGIDARASRDAGSYLCNYLSWRAIEAVGQGCRFAACGFRACAADPARRRHPPQRHAAHHAGRSRRCRRSAADGDGEAGAEGGVATNPSSSSRRTPGRRRPCTHD